MRKSWLLVSATAMLVAGCATAEEPAPPATTTAPAAFTTLAELSEAVATSSDEAESARISFVGGLSGPDEMRGTGAFTFAGGHTAMTMTLLSPTDEAVEMRLVDEVLYVRGAEEAEPGKPWGKLDLAGGGPMATAFGSATATMRSVDPRRSLREVAEIGELSATGPAQVDGAQVTRYAIDVDLAAFAELRGASAEEVAELPSGTLTYAVFLDGDNLPRRLSVELPVPTSNYAIDYTDWGKPVTVEAPPAAQVADLPES